MNTQNDDRLQKFLRNAMGPVADSELKRDLWPEMLQKLEARPAQVPWFDWALVAFLAIWFSFSPEAIPILLYHL